MQAKSKPPFDQLVASLSPTIIKKPVCLLQVGGTSTLDDAAKKLVAVVAGQPDWTPSRFGSCLGLSDARIGELAACESDGDGKANQMEGIILAWAENLGEGATVEAVLKSLYDEDESEILEKFTELTVSGMTPLLFYLITQSIIGVGRACYSETRHFLLYLALWAIKRKREERCASKYIPNNIGFMDIMIVV